MDKTTLANYHRSLSAITTVGTEKPLTKDESLDLLQHINFIVNCAMSEGEYVRSLEQQVRDLEQLLEQANSGLFDGYETHKVEGGAYNPVRYK